MTSSSTPGTCEGPTGDVLFDNGDLTESYVAVSSETLHHVWLVELHLTKSASSFQTIYEKKSSFTVNV
jgi:glycine cleavage system H lipoate-binding protein